ncbi:MAG TPA: hypothetical protein VE956_17885 [Nodularia sp. (in: cyanobacteria)]|nr:hypothetical protein [Nodularia sp. (in: cyanobacteria)]
MLIQYWLTGDRNCEAWEESADNLLHINNCFIERNHLCYNL